MLKIKDNVDLKELEKYGFKYERGYEWQGYKAYNLICDDYKLEVVDDDRLLILESYERYCYVAITSVLYDLIKDGLVEKVEG